MNIAVVRGTLSSEPRVRELPSGTNLAALELTVRAEGEPTESVPVSWFAPAPAVLGRCAPGTELVVIGRVRRRFYRTGAGTSSATEVVAEHVLPPGRRARLDRLLAEVAARLSEPESVG
jgi:single-strand DNA-binding protein